MTQEKSINPLMQTYGRFPLTLVRGEGAEVYDSSDRRYIDFLSGISVCSLGHCPPKVVEALQEQLQTLWHVSNLYHIPSQDELAALLVKHSFADQVFFCNSGTEAVEGCLKLARIASAAIHGKKKNRFIAMEKSFHGRSLGSLSVTGQSQYQEPFLPLLPEVSFVPFGDMQAIEKLNIEDVAAIITEPLQAEGGLNSPPEGYLQALRTFCDEKKILLIFDEVQVGVGRLGTKFASDKFAVEPDIMALAKGLAGGFPIGAVLAKREFSQYFVPGTHASTFGGNPLAMRAALEVVKTVMEDEFLVEIKKRESIIQDRFGLMSKNHKNIVEKKGLGLLQGLRFDTAVGPLVKLCMDKGLLVGGAGANVLRLAPSLNIEIHLLEEGLDLLEEALKEFSS